MSAPPRLRLPELLKRLREGLPLPKDRDLRSRRRKALHRYEPRDRKHERAMLWALTSASAVTNERRRATKIANCSAQARCGCWECYICRTRAWQANRRLVRMMTRGIDTDHVSFLTVVVEVTHEGIGVAEDLIDNATKQLKEVFDRWPEVQVVGRFEVDILVPGEETGRFKLKTLTELGFREDHEVPALLVHLHFIVAHPRPSRPWLRIQIAKAFQGTRRVELRPLRATREREESLHELVRYPLKFQAPKSTLPSRKTRTAKPRNERLLLFYCRMIQHLGGFGGLLLFTHLNGAVK